VKSILVVEDDAIARTFLEKLLASEGYLVRSAAHAGEAQAQLFDFDPDLILMDIQLPGAGGLELTKRLRQNPNKRHIRIVAMTGFAEEYGRDRAISAGCDDYLLKPFRAQALLSVIAAHLEPRPS
jgi:two-component system cell cycle response regulator DivK